MKSKMQMIVRKSLGVICGILIGAAASSCAGWRPVSPLVKWWFNDSRDEKAFVRKECDSNGENCKLVEKLSYEEADGYYALSPVDWERRETYIKSLEQNCK